ncbi:LPS translocon maturation chaperone LptM [Maricaulaceae bacterium MS644]
MTRLAIAFLAAAAALVLSGCGIRGDLERPPPLWGEDNRPEAAADAPASEEDEDDDAEPGERD